MCVFPRWSSHGHAHLVTLSLVFYLFCYFKEQYPLSQWPNKRFFKTTIVFYITSDHDRHLCNCLLGDRDWVVSLAVIDPSTGTAEPRPVDFTRFYNNLVEQSPHYEVPRYLFKHQDQPRLSDTTSTSVVFIRIIQQDCFATPR